MKTLSRRTPSSVIRLLLVCVSRAASSALSTPLIAIDTLSTFKKIVDRVEDAPLMFEDDVGFGFGCVFEHQRRRFIEQMMVQALKP